MLLHWKNANLHIKHMTIMNECYFMAMLHYCLIHDLDPQLEECNIIPILKHGFPKTRNMSNIFYDITSGQLFYDDVGIVKYH